MRNLCHTPGFVNGVGQGFLTENVLTFLHRRDGDGRVQIVGGADHHGIHIFLLFEQLTEVNIGCAAVIVSGSLFRAVIRVNNLLTRFAAGDASCRPQRMCP